MSSVVTIRCPEALAKRWRAAMNGVAGRGSALLEKALSAGERRVPLRLRLPAGRLEALRAHLRAANATATEAGAVLGVLRDARLRPQAVAAEVRRLGGLVALAAHHRAKADRLKAESEAEVKRLNDAWSLLYADIDRLTEARRALSAEVAALTSDRDRLRREVADAESARGGLSAAAQALADAASRVEAANGAWRAEYLATVQELARMRVLADTVTNGSVVDRVAAATAMLAPLEAGDTAGRMYLGDARRALEGLSGRSLRERAPRPA